MKKFKLNGFGKRQVTLLSLVILIAVAGYINLTHKEQDTVPASTEVAFGQNEPKQDSYFTASRLEKEKSRSAAMDVYREVANSQQSTADAKADAQKSLAASAKAMETEAALEALIKAKGFEDVVVYITGDSANIVVKTIGLTPAQAAQIKDLVIENAKIKSDKIKIVEIK